jgi:UDP-N-acetylglucosamine 2-epimerase (non-hydrolysing)
LKKKISVVVGTRPEAIKMAPVILELKKRSDDFDVSVCATGQHTTMLTGAFSAFGIRPDTKLSVMKPGQSLAQLTARLLIGLDKHFVDTRPDVVLVHGDTTSAMVGALAAFYRGISVGHVEAGLRTGSLISPFPEEYNRCSVSISACYHFAPTLGARDNLLQEGKSSKDILVTGNTVIDALLYTVGQLEQNPRLLRLIKNNLDRELGFDSAQQKFILITAHRRENWVKGLDNICSSIQILAAANPNFFFVYPVHLNPNVKNIVDLKLSGLKNVVLISPQNYQEFSWLLRSCYFVLTDSGGIQEEAPALGKPVLVMRDTSERPEAIKAGTAKLVTTDPYILVAEAQRLIDDIKVYESMAYAVNPFGDGYAAVRIVDRLMDSRHA